MTHTVCMWDPKTVVGVWIDESYGDPSIADFLAAGDVVEDAVAAESTADIKIK